MKFVTGPVRTLDYRPFADDLSFEERRHIYDALKAAGIRCLEGQHMFGAHTVYLHQDADRRKARRIALKAVSV